MGSTVNIGTPSNNTVTSAILQNGSVITTKIADDAVNADKLANSINTAIAANTAKTTNATHTGEVTGGTALTIADNVVDEANLKVSNSPSNGYFLSAQSGNTGGLTWAQVTTDLVGDTSPQLGGDLDLNGSIISVGDGGKDANQEHIRFGNDGDLRIYHNGSNSFIQESGTGALYIDASQIYLTKNETAETMAKFFSDGSVELYYNNVKKLSTTSNGIKLDDNTRIGLGDNEDLLIYHDGSQSYLANSTGNLNISSGAAITLKTNTSEAAVICNNNGSVDLYHNNTKTFETHATGYKSVIAGSPRITIGSTNASGAMLVLDGDSDGDGSGNDYAFIQHDTSGRLNIQNYMNQAIKFSTAGVSRWDIQGGGHFVPQSNNSYDIGADGTRVRYLYIAGGFNNSGYVYSNLIPSSNNSYDLGTSSNRWRNVYTNDLHLSNVGHTNDVDGSWGDWTIQEGESDLFLKNNRSGKKYKFNLTEVS